jgi:uncharacterized protein (TIGR01777 family)
MKSKIILAGGSGFLGQTLANYFEDRGFEIVILTRSPDPGKLTRRSVLWDACTPGAWQEDLEHATAVINLTGKSVNCRYDARNRKEILDSRLNSTRVLGEAIARCIHPPLVWLNASTATIYKHSLDKAWDENGELGATPAAKDAFSIEVAKAWEAAFEGARTPSTRKVAMRLAMVLGKGKNSVFPTLRRLTRLGLGGRMGSGQQFVSWIHEEDYCRAVEWLIGHDEIYGHINIAAPNPVSNCKMMKRLREVCEMPFGLPASNWMLELGAFFLRTETELIIKSRKVIPGRLLESGFRFQFPVIRAALEDLCRK